MEVTEAGGPFILSKVVTMSVAQGVDQVCPRLGGRGGHILRKKQAVAASIFNQQHVRAATGKPGGGASNPRGSASSQKSQ
jgi:hypothetical protein